ncbi:hypothetical protein FG167_01390 [Lacinutrix sp. WUR7]|uniref:hypothetical protein n=1 Tax=Lacinutrix sp. WUR7 TaxID=2653681 RepID=UPI00193E979A|nr:hypothetical protein [Lacinutrix sp. WUR7]QRM87930.1 hypothetical protein FG167_01390 [Lacinutrix sp. WUR7]
MKKSILISVFVLLTITVFFTSCSKDDQEFIVGQESLKVEEISNVELINLEGDKISTNLLKIQWEKQMKEEGYLVELITFEIIETYDEQSNKLYFLKTTSKDGTIETGAFLINDGKGTYKLWAKECTCIGCPNGCRLEVDGSTCTCSGCGTDTSKKCTKSETVLI